MPKIYDITSSEIEFLAQTVEKYNLNEITIIKKEYDNIKSDFTLTIKAKNNSENSEIEREKNE